MTPLKLTIQGDFWDSYVYRDRLYLWMMDHSVRVYQFSSMLEAIGGRHDNIFIPLVLGEGNKLYREVSFASIARDADVRKVIHSKLESAGKLRLEYELADLDNHLMGEQQSPFPDLTDDLTIFANRVYGSGGFGLQDCETHKKTKNRYMIDRHPNKLWDGIAARLRPGKRSLAIAGLDAGLYELDPFEPGEPKLVSSRHASDVDWMFASIYATSPHHGNFLACYRWVVEEASANDRKTYRREFAENIDLDTFVRPALANWARQEKLYRATAKGVDVFRYTQGKVYDSETRAEAFESIGSIAWGTSIYDYGPLRRASVSYFGSVIEYENGIKVLQSGGKTFNIKENVARWRVFPKSKNYENHLHVIFEDRIEIVCFIDDFLIDQHDKLAGIEFRETGMWQE